MKHKVKTKLKIKKPVPKVLIKNTLIKISLSKSKYKIYTFINTSQTIKTVNFLIKVPFLNTASGSFQHSCFNHTDISPKRQHGCFMKKFNQNLMN